MRLATIPARSGRSSSWCSRADRLRLLCRRANLLLRYRRLHCPWPLWQRPELSLMAGRWSCRVRAERLPAIGKSF